MSLPNFGGMRHINVVPGLADQACGEIRGLDEEDIRKVRDVIAQLKEERGPTDRQLGSASSVARHAGKFSFNEGEYEALVSEVLAARKAGIA